MYYLILVFLLIFSMEVLKRSNYIELVFCQIKLAKRASYIILNKNINDHLKEKIIIQYSILMLKNSFYMLLNFGIIIFIFSIPCILIRNYIDFIFSIRAIITSIFIFIIYRNFIKYIKNA